MIDAIRRRGRLPKPAAVVPKKDFDALLRELYRARLHELNSAIGTRLLRDETIPEAWIRERNRINRMVKL